MTFQSPTTIPDVLQVFNACLTDPGTVMNKLYRSDGIIQNTIISQLFANYYRVDPYKYLVTTSHDNALMNLDQYFAINRNSFELHYRRDHPEVAEELTIHENCGDDCIKKVLSTISSLIQEYGKIVRQVVEEEGDEEVMEIVLLEYHNYINFMVVMEDKLPSLSFLIKNTIPHNYSNSLWRFLYMNFMEHFVNPLENHLREILVNGIRKLRETSLNGALNRTANKMETDFFAYTVLDTVPRLRELALLLADKDLNEKSVHFLESTNYTPDIALEEAIQAQTTELYQEYNNISGDRESMVMADLTIFQKVFLPSRLKKPVAHCIEIAEKLWNVKGNKIKGIMDEYEDKDTEIEFSAKKLKVI